MNPIKYAQMIKYLTRAKKANPNLPDVFPANKAPIPAKTQNVKEMEAVNQFMLRNPRVEKNNGGSLKFYPKASGGETIQPIGPGVDLKVRDLNYGGTLGYEGDKFYGGVEYNTGKVKFDITDSDGTTLVKDTLSKDDAVNFIIGLGDRKGDKFQIKTDKDFTNMQVTFRKSFADGGRIGFNDGRLVKNKKRLKQLNKETALYTDGRYKTYDSVPDRKLRQKIGQRATLRAQGKNVGAGSGSPGVPRPVGEDFVSPMKDARIASKQRQTIKTNFQEKPVGKRLQWIANNGKNYNNTKDFIKAYEKHFNHKIGSKKDVLFNTPGKKPLTQIDNLMNTGRTQQDLFTLTFKDGKAFNREELFKASIIQNNPDIQKDFKELFNLVHNNVSELSELGPEGLVENLNKGKLFKEFDFVKSGVGSGITRNSLLNVANINPDHLTSYQNVRKPLLAISQIIESLKNPEFAKGYGISATTAKKIRGELDNFFTGQKGLQADIKKINNQLGDVKFNQIFGGVNFEHTLAKAFGKDYKYLPRNYLLKGQFTTKSFNLFKRDVFDLPLIKLMKEYEQGKVGAEVVQNFINDFNAKTNGYADFNFDADKGRLVYSDDAVKYDLSRYQNPAVARDELIKNIDLTMSSEFQKGFKNLPESKDQLKLFKSKEAKNIRSLLAKIGCPGLASGGRAGFDVGTNCQIKGAELINSGMKNVTPAQAKNFAAFANKAASLGRGVMKYGIIPEALFVAADSLIRVGMGDSFNEAFLRASDYLRPGDQTKKAEMLEADRFFGPEVAGIIGKSIDYKNELAKVQSLKDQKANLENLSGDGTFDYVGDTSQDVKNIDAQIKQATDNLNNKFKMTDAERIYAERMQEETDDARGSGSFFTKLKSKFRDVEPDSDIETLGVPEQTQKNLNKKLLPTLLDAKDIMQYTTQDAINLAQAYRASGEKVSAKDILAYRDSLKNASLSELAQRFNPESVYGASGTMGEPIDKPVFKKPQNVIGDIEKEIVGQTNVANPFDLDISDIGTGLRGFSAAGGGIAKMAGVSSGIAPESGPNSQGLLSLKNRVRNY